MGFARLRLRATPWQRPSRRSGIAAHENGFQEQSSGQETREDGWGERWDLNPRPPGPQPGALTN